MTWLKAGALSSFRRPDLWTPTGSPGGPRLRRAWRVDPAGFSFFFFVFFSFFFFRFVVRPRRMSPPVARAPAGWGQSQAAQARGLERSLPLTDGFWVERRRGLRVEGGLVRAAAPGQGLAFGAGSH